MSRQRRIVIQAYGREDIVRQALFSVLTILSHGFSGEILIYTDQREKLASFFSGTSQVSIREISGDELQKWRGAIQFVHRVKLEILKDAARGFAGTLLYLDGDTVMRASADKVFDRMTDQDFVMHVKESQLGSARDLLTKKIAKFCRRNKFQLAQGLVSIPPSTDMWNAGVIGLPPTHFSLLDSMLELTDVAYQLYPKHVIEQLAVSYYLQTAGPVRASDDLILHYWQTKEIWQGRIDLFLSLHKSVSSALPALKSFDWSEPAPPNQKKWWQIFS